MRRRTSTVAILLSLALLPATAWADNTTCANAEFLMMGIGRGQTIGSGTPRYYKVPVVAGRSYSVYSWAPFQDVGEGSASINHTFYTSSTCATVAATTDTTNAEPTSSVDGHSGDNDTIIPTFTGTMYIQVSNLTAAGSYTIYTAIQETTIFSPWWFVGGTNQAFAEIKNTTTSSIPYTLTMYRANGAVCGTSSGTLSGNGNTAVSIGTVGTCAAAVSGSAQVAYQGPPGAFVANITTIDGVQGTSFDAPFSPRMPWAISTQ